MAAANNSETEYETSHESDREQLENEPEVASALTPEESEASGDEEIEFEEADVTIQAPPANSDESPAQRAARSVQSALEQLPPDVINAIRGEYASNPTANLAQLLVCQPAQQSATEASEAETVVTVVPNVTGSEKRRHARRVQSVATQPAVTSNAAEGRTSSSKTQSKRKASTGEAEFSKSVRRPTAATNGSGEPQKSKGRRVGEKARTAKPPCCEQCVEDNCPELETASEEEEPLYDNRPKLRTPEDRATWAQHRKFLKRVEQELAAEAIRDMNRSASRRAAKTKGRQPQPTQINDDPEPPSLNWATDESGTEDEEPQPCRSMEERRAADRKSQRTSTVASAEPRRARRAESGSEQNSIGQAVPPPALIEPIATASKDEIRQLIEEVMASRSVPKHTATVPLTSEPTQGGAPAMGANSDASEEVAARRRETADQILSGQLQGQLLCTEETMRGLLNEMLDRREAASTATPAPVSEHTGTSAPAANTTSESRARFAEPTEPSGYVSEATSERRRELARLNTYPKTRYPDTEAEEEQAPPRRDGFVEQGESPMNKYYTHCTTELGPRLQIADAEYREFGRVLIKNRNPFDQRKYVDEQYLSSDTTDAESIYSTSQEDTDTVEDRYAGLTDRVGGCDNHEFWPKRKMRRAHKHIRRHRRERGLRSQPPDKRYGRSLYQPVKTAQWDQGIRQLDEERRNNKMDWHFKYMKGNTAYGHQVIRDLGALVSELGFTRRQPSAPGVPDVTGQTMAQATSTMMRVGAECRSRRQLTAHDQSSLRVVDEMMKYQSQTDDPRERGFLLPSKRTRSATGPSRGRESGYQSSGPELARATSHAPRAASAPRIQPVDTTIAPGVTLSASAEAVESQAGTKGETTIRIVHEHKHNGGGDSDVYNSRDFKVPVFVGKNWISFKNKFESVACARKWDDKTKARALYNAIQNDAADALGEADSINWTYERLVAHMERRHGRNKTWGDVLPQARNLRRRSGQTLSAFYDQVINLLNQANLGEEHFRAQAYQTFLQGIECNKPMINEIMPQVTKHTIQELCDLAEAYEARHGASFAGHMPVHVNMVASADDYEDASPHCGTQTVAAATTTPAPPVATSQPVGEALVGQQATLQDVAQGINTLSGRIGTLNEKVDYMQGVTDKRFDSFDRRFRHIEGRPTREEEFAQNGFSIPARPFAGRGRGQGRGGGRRPYNGNSGYQGDGYRQNNAPYQQQGGYGAPPPANPYYQQGPPPHAAPQNSQGYAPPPAPQQAPFPQPPQPQQQPQQQGPRPQEVQSRDVQSSTQDVRFASVNQTVQGGGQPRQD